LKNELDLAEKNYNALMLKQDLSKKERDDLLTLIQDIKDRFEYDVLQEKINQKYINDKLDLDLAAQTKANGVIAAEKLRLKQLEVDDVKARAENAERASAKADADLKAATDANSALQSTIETTSTLIKTLQKGQQIMGGAEINSPNYLQSGTCIRSNKGYTLCVGTDGIIRVYSAEMDAQQRNITKWEAHPNSTGKAPYKLYMQEDGNLCLYDDRGTPVWCTNTYGKGQKPFKAIIQDDGNFVVYDKNKSVIWMNPPPPAPAPPDPYGPLLVPSLMLKHEVTNKCLNEKLGFSACSGLDNVKWQPINKGNNKFFLKNLGTGKCLDGNGSSLYTIGCNGGDYQSWNATAVNNAPGRYTFKHLSGKCLDGDGGSTYFMGCGSGYQIFKSA
jgi:hypothetical protein